MPGRKRRKSQAGLEYLLTYGWALVLIATLIGILATIAIFPTGNTWPRFPPATLICKAIHTENNTSHASCKTQQGKKSQSTHSKTLPLMEQTDTES